MQRLLHYPQPGCQSGRGGESPPGSALPTPSGMQAAARLFATWINGAPGSDRGAGHDRGRRSDVSTPWQGHGEALAARDPHARVEHLPAAHLSNVERPRSFTALLNRFLIAGRLTCSPPGQTSAARSSGTTTWTAHMRPRRYHSRLPGSDHALCLGTIWQRPGLDDRTRRLLVLATAAALGRWEEFRLHVRTGLAAGLEPCDIEETLLQAAVYAGVPAANTAFQIAPGGNRKVLSMQTTHRHFAPISRQSATPGEIERGARPP